MRDVLVLPATMLDVGDIGIDRLTRWLLRTVGTPALRFVPLRGRLPTLRLLRRRGQRTRRYPCVWCGVPDRWPDRCSEMPGQARGRCAAMIEFQCGLGDHRRCDVSACVVAARWHEPVRRAGVTAAREAGMTWAVVSTIENGEVVIGTDNDLGRAISLLRASALRRAGVPIGPEGVGLVYVVRGSDGALF